MERTKDSNVRDLGRLTLTLRNDLVFTPQKAGGDTYYIVEDPVRSKFHRVGLAEYTLISLLDGRICLDDAVQLVASAAPEQALSLREAAAICRWLVDAGLAHTSGPVAAGRLLEEASAEDIRSFWQRWNPVMLKLPLVHPDPFFEVLVRWLGWMHGPAGLASWVAVMLFATWHVASSREKFAESSAGILAPGNWLGLFVSWIVLKLLHEISHGIACKRYGGTVREAGVLLILFAPVAYVDVTSSWRFRSPWQRIHTAAAGMYLELFVAALAALVWCRSQPGMVNSLCYQIVIMGSVATVIINANPLMRFDGYYILSDLLDIPNLYASGQQYLQYGAQRYLLGERAELPAWTRSRRHFITVYGAAAFAWRILVCVCLAVGATALFHGLGLVLAILAVAGWSLGPIKRLVKFLARDKSRLRASVPRLLATSGIPAVLAALSLVTLPWPGTSRAPAVVEYAPLTLVRAASAGFVRELRVNSGASVQQGQVIALLDNDELCMELAELDAAIGQSELNMRAFQQAEKLAAYQAELKTLVALREKRITKSRQVEQLVVRAPASGKIISRNLDARVGIHLNEGDEILAIGNEQQKELTIAVSQRSHDAFQAYVGEFVHVRLRPHGSFRSRLALLEPQASLEPAHAALCAAMGGPLPVKQAAEGSRHGDAKGERYELLAPHFTGSVRLSPAQGARLKAGQVGIVSIRPLRESLGGHLLGAFSSWLREKFRSAVQGVI
jgi:putative peptide zinc metalloprotease protein